MGRLPVVVNVFHARFEYDHADPDGYRGGVARVGEGAGGAELTVKLCELPPGQAPCPYHSEYVDEWVLVPAPAALTPRAAQSGLFAAKYRSPSTPSRSRGRSTPRLIAPNASSGAWRQSEATVAGVR
jgi:hypothetical protein